MSILKWQANSSTNFSSFFSVITQLLRTFLAQTLYTLVKSKQLKCKFLRLSSARGKIRQNLRVSFETASQFLFIIIQYHYT